MDVQTGSGGREDGEVSESEGEYTPLARPADYASMVVRMGACTSPGIGAGAGAASGAATVTSMSTDERTDESEHEPSSSADSDSDNKPAPKKRKLRIKRLRKSDTNDTTKHNKYNIWCKMVQEDTLADDLLVCDVTSNNYLGIETYHPRLHYNEEDMTPFDGEDKRPGFARYNNKRQFRDRKNVKLRLGRRNSYDSDNEKGEMRHIPDLDVTSISPVEDVAKDIAAKLCEEKDNLIMRIVEHAGRQKAIDIFKETKRIEEDGGMIVRNGTRRRTPGGVFIFLLKRDKDVTHEMSSKIFLEDKIESKERSKARFKYRNKKVEELKQSLADSVLPAIRPRAEQWVAAQIAAEDLNHHVSNPPPSPATDGRDGSSDVDTNQYAPLSPRRNSTDPNMLSIARETAVLSRLTVTKEPGMDPRAHLSTSYDDDFIDIGCGDDMDLF